MTEPDMAVMMRASHAARLLGVRPDTVRRWIRNSMISGTYVESPSGVRRYYVYRNEPRLRGGKGNGAWEV